MTYLLFFSARSAGYCSNPGWLRECKAAFAATHALPAQNQPFRMPFIDARNFPGTRAEYDIPVMPRWLRLCWWAAHNHTSLCRGDKTQTIGTKDIFADLSGSPFIGSQGKVIKVPYRFDYRSVKCRL